MSYNGEEQTFNDTALERYTSGLMEDVIKFYHDKHDEDNICRLLERDVAKKLSPWIPEKYTEVDIVAMVGSKYTSMIAEFMTDNKTMMVVCHEEVNSPEKVVDKVASIISTPMTLGVSSRGTGEKDRFKPDALIKKYEEYAGVYDPLSITEDFWFPQNVQSRGTNVETLHGGKCLGELSDVEYFQHKLKVATGIPNFMTERINLKESVGTGMFDDVLQLQAKVWEGLRVPSGYFTKGFVNEGALVPKVAKTNHMGIQHNPQIDYTTISSLNMARAEKPFDNKSTCGWSDEITAGNGIVRYDPIVANADIEFTMSDLDELADLINDVRQEVMTFE